MPTTRFAGRPDFCFITQTIASSGLVMQITNASGQLALMPCRHLGDHAGVLADQVVARHAGRAREAGGDDHHIGALDRRVVGAAGHQRVEPVDRAGLHDVERLAGRHAAEHVEQHDVAEFLQADQMSERAADIAGADQGDLVAGHRGVLTAGEGTANQIRCCAPGARRPGRRLVASRSEGARQGSPALGIG